MHTDSGWMAMAGVKISTQDFRGLVWFMYEIRPTKMYKKINDFYLIL